LTERICCCIQGCRRTFKRGPDDSEIAVIMCGRHWRMGDERMRKRHKQLRRRSRWFARKWERRKKAIEAEPKVWAKFHQTWERACDADHKMWNRIREDVTIKAALGAEDAPSRKPRADVR
jgi:hypothetical protein